MRKQKIKKGLIYVLTLAIILSMIAVITGILYLISMLPAKFGIATGVILVVLLVFIAGYISG